MGYPMHISSTDEVGISNEKLKVSNEILRVSDEKLLLSAQKIWGVFDNKLAVSTKNPGTHE